MRTLAVTSISLLVLGAAGCATGGDMDALSQRVSALEAQSEADTERIEALEASFDDVAETARRSLERSAEAEARAREAASSADDAARKADAIFNKSVSK